MSSIFSDDPPTKELPVSVCRATSFFSNSAVLVIILVIVIISIIAMWLFGSGIGDRVLDGLILPIGFPTYVIRNLFNTVAIILIAVAAWFLIPTLPELEGSVFILLFIIICVALLISEGLLEFRRDANGAGLTCSLAATATLFLIVASWQSANWIKLILILPLLWFVYLTLELLFLARNNA